MSGRCAGCRYWDANTADRAFLREHYRMDDGGLCRHPALRAVIYGYAADAELATRADFGCVQFEAR